MLWRPLDLRLHAYDRFGAIGKTEAGAAVGGGDEVGFCGEGAEGGGEAGVGADGGVEGERGVEVGELGGGEGGGSRVWGHGWVLWWGGGGLNGEKGEGGGGEVEVGESEGDCWRVERGLRWDWGWLMRSVGFSFMDAWV